MRSFPIPFEVEAGRFLESGLCSLEKLSVPVVSTSWITAVALLNKRPIPNISINRHLCHIQLVCGHPRSARSHSGAWDCDECAPRRGSSPFVGRVTTEPERDAG